MRFRVFLLVAALPLATASWAAAQPSTSAPEAPEGYVWAGACKECHADIYKSWSQTKHAKALNRLGGADREKECVGCHITGTKALVRVDGDIKNAGIQCESCHGPGAKHAEQAKVSPPALEGLTKPTSAVCVACHNDKSPYYRGFLFDGMKSLVHPVTRPAGK